LNLCKISTTTVCQLTLSVGFGRFIASPNGRVDSAAFTSVVAAASAGVPQHAMVRVHKGSAESIVGRGTRLIE